jgi:hypothetical protein
MLHIVIPFTLLVSWTLAANPTNTALAKTVDDLSELVAIMSFMMEESLCNELCAWSCKFEKLSNTTLEHRELRHFSSAARHEIANGLRKARFDFVSRMKDLLDKPSQR